MDWSSVLPGEEQAFNVTVGLTPSEAFPGLSSSPGAKGRDGAWVDGNISALVIFRGRRGAFATLLGHRVLDVHHAGIEVDVLPTQSHQLASTHPGCGAEGPQW